MSETQWKDVTPDTTSAEIGDATLGVYEDEAGFHPSVRVFLPACATIDDAKASAQRAHEAAIDAGSRAPSPDTAQLLARVVELERERDRLNLRVGGLAQQLTEAKAERDNAYVRTETAERRVAELEAALALLPDETDMAENNPDEGLRTFCCGQEVKSLGLDLLITHDEECWYARMCAIRARGES